MSDNQEQLIKEFVRELQTMTESRPPISKAKMMSITKSALKSIKYYKHIVMNVEKFISKCKPEYKIPGLYVIDSIVRQSRHQHGIEKDVYGLRFAKNILTTLHHVEKCPADDKNKISRVLNLWEKNAIFPPELIKQLFQVHQSIVNTEDLLEKSNLSIETHNTEKSLNNNELNRFRELQETLLRASGKHNTETTSILTEIQQITNQLLESQKKPTTTNNTNDEPSSTTTSLINTSEPIQSNVANVLDDFDYGSDNDDDNNEPRGQLTTMNLPPTNIQQSVQFFQPPPTMLLNPTHSNPVSFPIPDANHMSIPMSFDPSHPPPMFFQQSLPPSLSIPQTHSQINYNHHHPQIIHQIQPNDVDLRPEDMESDSTDDHRHHQYNRRRSRSPSPTSSQSKRTRSSSNSNNRRDSVASRLKETEKRERRRKGLPPLKEDHLVVSSRTIWLGHLPKIITEIDLREHLEAYGEINDINHIPPRGCAFVCFKERSDAARCLEKMKDFRLHGNSVKIGWATNKGVKDRFKEYWDADHGCTYIPYSEIKNMPHLSALADGGVIDDESLPSYLKTTAPPGKTEVPPLIQQQQQPVTQAYMHPQVPYIHQEFQSQANIPASGPTNIHLDSSNRLPQGPTILMAQSSHESPIRLGVPVQMMPPGAQIIQLQQHPHGQHVQVVQRITGRVFPNSQIVHQMPYGHVVTATGQPPLGIQLQHHPGELKDINGQTLAPGGGLHLLTNATAVPTHHLMTTAPVATNSSLTTATFAHTVEGSALIQLHDNNRRQVSPLGAPKHFDESQLHHMSSTDEQLLRLSTSSSTHLPPPSLLGGPMSPTRIHQNHPPPLLSHHHPHQQQQQQQQQQSHQFGSNVVLSQQPQPLLPIPTTNDEHKKQSPFPRRPNRFEEREDPIQKQDNNNGNYSGYRGGRNNFNDRTNSNRGKSSGNLPGRGHYNNNNININTSDRNDRSDSNDNNGGGFRNRNNFNRGGRGSQMGGNNNNNSGSSRFYPRAGGGGGHRGSSHEHSSSRRSSRSPDRTFSFRHDHPTDEPSYRSLPIEALRKRDQSNSDISTNDSNKSSTISDETNLNRSGQTTN